MKEERKQNMNTLMNPWNLLEEILNTNSRTVSRLRACAAGKFPPANVYLDDHAIELELELPGKTSQDIDLTLEAQAVVVAERPAQPADGGEKAAPAWSRRFTLPFRVNADKANAAFADGILTIRLPKADEIGVRHLTIQG